MFSYFIEKDPPEIERTNTFVLLNLVKNDFISGQSTSSGMGFVRGPNIPPPKPPSKAGLDFSLFSSAIYMATFEPLTQVRDLK